MFPEHSGHIVANRELKTIMEIAQFLYNKGYRSVTFVAGSDRLPDFENLLKSYNGVEGKKSYYNFKTINFVSSGEREDGGDGLAGISATKAREAAVKSDQNAFAQATGAGKLASALYNAVRKGMNVTEDAAGVGVVATNKRMAKDPRYSTSMTVDVKPSTPTKNAKAFKLV